MVYFNRKIKDIGVLCENDSASNNVVIVTLKEDAILHQEEIDAIKIELRKIFVGNIIIK